MIWNIRKKTTTNQNKKKKEFKKKNPTENSVNSLWENFKSFNIRVIGVPKGEEKDQEIGNLSEK